MSNFLHNFIQRAQAARQEEHDFQTEVTSLQQKQIQLENAVLTFLSE